MNYRAEVDGLRAVAVIPVILFHAGFELFSGGFVGVDVFFVISGYLITSILIEDLDNNEFSILEFYKRRARRILPALFFVIFCTLPFAWLWMMPRDILNFAQSLGATSFFVSNLYFMKESGYFGPTAEEMPLLHTWSLAVEEQFYIFFPILLLLIWRFGRNGTFWLIVTASAMSFALSEWMSRSHPIENFFLSPTRAWELLAGSLCALSITERGVKGNQIGAGLGLFAVLASFFVFDESIPTPSVYALLPVGGTVLILLYGHRSTLVSRILSIRPIVGIGLISYSAYLWHQPLFAFARLRNLQDPSAGLLFILSLASLLLAYFSWRFVEQPFRRRNHALLESRRRTFIASGVGMLAIFGVGVVIALQDGLPWRFQGEVLSALRAKSEKAPGTCHFNKDREFKAPVPECQHNVAKPLGRVLFLGDSHATVISKEIYPQLNREGLDVYRTSFTGCISLSGFKIYNRRDYHPCSEFVEFIEDFASRSGTDTIVLIARFPMYYWGRGFDNGEGGVERKKPSAWDIKGLSDSEWDSAARRERLLNGMRDRIQALSEDFNIVLVAPIPEAGWNVPDYLAKQIFFGENSSGTISTSFARYLERAHPIIDLFSELDRSHENISFAPIHNALCSAATGRCLNAKGGEVYYYDNDHLSKSGSKLVIPLIREAVLSVAGK